MKPETATTVINFVGSFILTSLLFATTAVAGRLFWEMWRDGFFKR